jgi:aspartate/methionine/tyrosine aminotransferase
VTPVLVSLPSLEDNFADKLIPALEETYQTATIPIKALIITNPHNPLAVCYPKKIIESLLQFCEKHDLHFVSDEIYALSIFPNPEVGKNIDFVSALSIDLDRIGVDPSRVHVVWSMSKDFGQSGFRMVNSKWLNFLSWANLV